MRIQCCDNSGSLAKEIWRTDCNQQSLSSIRKFLDGRLDYVKFEKVVFDLDLAEYLEMSINKETFKDSESIIIITNGTSLILNKILMTIER